MTNVRKLRSHPEIEKRSKNRAESAKRIRLARVRAGFPSASEAAHALGIAVPTYLSHENGTRIPRADLIAEYAKLFGTTADWILFGHEVEVDHLIELLAHLGEKVELGAKSSYFAHVAGIAAILKPAV